MRPAAHRLAVLAVFVSAVLLRVPALDWLPSPAGDEGNWADYGLAISRGQPAALAPDAAFVSMLFAHLIAASIGVLGKTFTATRMVNVLGLLAGMALSYASLAGLGSRRAGLALASLLAVHPWTVMYSRTASVPYALALSALTAGPLLFVAGMLRGRAAAAGVGLVITSIGIHFSPLAAVGLIACGLFMLTPTHRWILRRRVTWAALAVAAAHGLPVVLGAWKVAQAAPELPQLDGFWLHVGQYLHMMGTGLMGEATVRHFTNAALTPMRATLLLVPLGGFLALGIRGGRGGLLEGFATLYFFVGLLVTPLILAPGRNWFLPANHMDRYLFALLPGYALLAGEIAARGRRAHALAIALLLAWPLAGTVRIGMGLLRGGVDHGEGIFDGGSGYRGWLVSETPRSTLVQIRETVLAEDGPGHAAILHADRTFLPLGFVMDGTRISVHDVRRTVIPASPNGVYFILLWPDGVLSVDDPPTANPKYVASNRNLRERMHRIFGRVRLVRVLRQPDQSPLIEVWRAEDPPPRLRLPAGRRSGTDAPLQGEPPGS